MEYYAIQVKTGSEEKYIHLFTSKHPGSPITLHFLQRRMAIRRNGKVLQELAPIFPGYLFAELEGPIPNTLYWALRKTDGFFRFLKSNQDVHPLSGHDLEIVTHFIKSGSIAEKSKVYFDEQDRIVVQEGPLKGLEGSIIKVDKRKGRAKIRLDLDNAPFTIDLAFEVISRV
ncbi:antiterminator LoaP [Gracilinema caldarium]|uniref:antiterminator LoaP n=1 Tax=Gracilinema caldarium TaxID=215591 RepID=UPI0026F16576|nr:antiterminator LoaP [Gracilinema caldarium]